ncbi:MAG: cell division protein FtsQ/DivIB [Mesorhizobium sp.]
MRDAFVLPKFLRKPARFAGRVMSGDVTVPRFAFSALAGIYLASAGLYGMAAGGHTEAVLQAITARSGFAIEDVRMAGNKETSEIDVLEKLELDGWTSLVGFDAEAARERIAQLPWIERVSVRKIYPDAIDISITEKKPLAIWQQGRELSLIGQDGKIIVPFESERYATLPFFAGVGANERASEFMARMAQVPQLSSRIRAYVRVADRRWDLRLENGITIRLPEYGEDAAIADVARLDAEEGLLSRDLAAVDMRVEDRVVVKLTPEAVTRRDAAMKERMKKTGPAGKRI